MKETHRNLEKEQRQREQEQEQEHHKRWQIAVGHCRLGQKAGAQSN